MWGGGEGQLLLNTVWLSCVPAQCACVYEMRAQPCVAVELRDEGVVGNEDGGWQSERAAAEGMKRWQGEPQNQLEVSEWTLPGGPGGEVTGGGVVVVSCQLLASRR